MYLGLYKLSPSRKFRQLLLYVPDTFAAGDEYFPQNPSDFQSFIILVRASGRNVSNGAVKVRHDS